MRWPITTLTSVGEPKPVQKSVSDALRWEMRYGRVRRLARGRYGPGWMPRGTEYRIHQRVLALRTEAAQLSLGGGQKARPDLDDCSGQPPSDVFGNRLHGAVTVHGPIQG
jgi:hypothetical protein